MPTAREKHIKLLVAKFVKLVESLNPGERLSIKKVGGPPPKTKKLEGKRSVKSKTGAEKAAAGTRPDK